MRKTCIHFAENPSNRTKIRSVRVYFRCPSAGESSYLGRLNGNKENIDLFMATVLAGSAVMETVDFFPTDYIPNETKTSRRIYIEKRGKSFPAQYLVYVDNPSDRGQKVRLALFQLPKVCYTTVRALVTRGAVKLGHIFETDGPPPPSQPVRKKKLGIDVLPSAITTLQEDNAKWERFFADNDRDDDY